MLKAVSEIPNSCFRGRTSSAGSCRSSCDNNVAAKSMATAYHAYTASGYEAGRPTALGLTELTMDSLIPYAALKRDHSYSLRATERPNQPRIFLDARHSASSTSSGVRTLGPKIGPTSSCPQVLNDSGLSSNPSGCQGSSSTMHSNAKPEGLK